MNILDAYTSKLDYAPSNGRQKKEERNQGYKDPLRAWPLKGLAYSNELGAVVSGVSPKLGTALWVPALMYFGADIYDKYKNEETSYNPSTKRGVKEAIFQTLASVILPTAAVHLGQRTSSSLARFSKTGLTLQTKQDVIEKSLSFMQSKSLHEYSANVSLYKEEFKNAVLTLTEDTKGDFRASKSFQKFIALLNPFKNSDSIVFAKENKLIDFSLKKAEQIFEIREALMQNECPKGFSKQLFLKFQTLQDEYKKIYPADRYMGKAAKNILKEWHKSEILKTKMLKTIGGFIALLLLLKPIDDFVEHIVIKKTIEPGLDYFSNEIMQRKERKSLIV